MVMLSLVIGGITSGIYMFFYLDDKTWGVFPIAGAAGLILWLIKEIFYKKKND